MGRSRVTEETLKRRVMEVPENNFQDLFKECKCHSHNDDKKQSLVHLFWRILFVFKYLGEYGRKTA